MSTHFRHLLHRTPSTRTALARALASASTPSARQELLVLQATRR